MGKMICNDQGQFEQNTTLVGMLPYMVNDYGANWATSATITADINSKIPSPQNGDAMLLHNTNATGGGPRLYLFSNGVMSFK